MQFGKHETPLYPTCQHLPLARSQNLAGFTPCNPGMTSTWQVMQSSLQPPLLCTGSQRSTGAQCTHYHGEPCEFPLQECGCSYSYCETISSIAIPFPCTNMNYNSYCKTKAKTTKDVILAVLRKVQGYKLQPLSFYIHGVLEISPPPLTHPGCLLGQNVQLYTIPQGLN